MLTSCSHEIIETRLKLFYTNGETEIITVKRHSKVMGKHELFNGCLYRRKHIDQMWGGVEYIGQIRCNINYYKTLSVQKYKYVK